MHYVYILELKNDMFYIGETANLIQRMRAHFYFDGCKTTAKYGVKRLICYWQCDNREQGRKFEKYLKTLSRERKIELMTNPHLLGAKFGLNLTGNYQFFSNTSRE